MKFRILLLSITIFTTSLLAQNIEKLQAMMKTAYDKIEEHNLYGALNEFNKILTLEPSYSPAFVGRAYTKSLLEKYEEAFKDIEQALEINENSDLAYATLGEIYLRLRNYKKALENFNKAITLNNLNNDALIGKINVLLLTENIKEAEKLADEAIEKDATNDGFYYIRGLVYNYKGKYEKAINEFDHALQLSPTKNLFNIYLNRGASKFIIQEYNEALEDLNMAIELNPYNSSAYHSRGRVYYETEDYENAITDFKKSLETDPENPVIFYNLGMALLRSDKTRDACEYFHKSSTLGYKTAYKMVILYCTE